MPGARCGGRRLVWKDKPTPSVGLTCQERSHFPDFPLRSKALDTKYKKLIYIYYYYYCYCYCYNCYYITFITIIIIYIYYNDSGKLAPKHVPSAYLCCLMGCQTPIHLRYSKGGMSAALQTASTNAFTRLHKGILISRSE